MSEVTQNPRTLKVFVASPSDVMHERQALARLVRDINDVLAFLAPARNLRVELVGYETHSYPDLGLPQEVINRQIPLDYDIFIGVMWKRCGTPTSTAPSGTIEEFRRAVEKRKKSGLPRIMFYFCEEPIALPDAEELAQLSEVVKFKAELARLGLTSSYPSHVEFSEHVRGGLLRAIRDILQEPALITPPSVSTGSANPALSKSSEILNNSSRSEMLSLTDEYVSLRASMPSGGERTRRMTLLFSRMKALAADARGSLEEFRDGRSEGQRLAAIAILQMFPHESYLDWLAERLDNPEVEKPFVGYQAAVALTDAVRALSRTNCAGIESALTKAKKLASKFPQDSGRLRVIEVAETEFRQKCSGHGSGQSEPDAST